MVHLHPNYHVIINEAAPNNDGQSFVELYVTVIDQDDEYIGDSKPKVGLVILEPVKSTDNKGEAKIVGTIDLTDLIDWPFTVPKYYIIGSPPDEWIDGPTPPNQGLPLTAHSKVRLNNIPPNNAFNVKSKSVKALILTKSHSKNFRFSPLIKNSSLSLLKSSHELSKAQPSEEY